MDEGCELAPKCKLKDNAGARREAMSSADTVTGAIEEALLRAIPQGDRADVREAERGPDIHAREGDAPLQVGWCMTSSDRVEGHEL